MKEEKKKKLGLRVRKVTVLGMRCDLIAATI